MLIPCLQNFQEKLVLAGSHEGACRVWTLGDQRLRVSVPLSNTINSPWCQALKLIVKKEFFPVTQSQSLWTVEENVHHAVNNKTQ